MKKQHRVTFIGDEAFVSELRSFIKTNADKMEIESVYPNKDPVRLGFDLGTAANVVTIVASVLYFGELGVSILNCL